ncbi:ribosome assembly RNA-binding protein YhbY [Atopobacter phocae]|uniref:ribosome assembly RNA-binding protein YhbY n=1 Tax=Atopobacter phocae TaxID=136492 RepID=UPI000472545D|nr:ribosome assembly RNA-binding protein YhbY [Atopobacter phocae]
MKKYTGKEKQFFKKEAHHLSPMVQIGKNGLSSELLDEIDRAIEKRELIKVTILQNSLVESKELAEWIESNHLADVIHIIGRTLILYRKSDDEKYQDLSSKFEAMFR